jgi:tetratricopeptide (TPR) repeat protein
MDSSTYVGRKVQKHILKQFLASALGVKNGATDPQAVSPRLFLVHGEGGRGKSAIIDLCIESIGELSPGNSPAAMVLDLHAWRVRNGALPVNEREMLDALYGVAAATDPRLAEALASFDALNKKAIEAEGTRRLLMEEAWPQELFRTAEPGRRTPDFSAWIGTKMAPEDLALIDLPVTQAAAAFVKCLADFSLHSPLLLCIDGLDAVTDPALVRWVQTDIIGPLTANRGALAVVAAGSDDFVRDCRNEFPDEQRYAVALKELSLSKRDIADLAQTRGIVLTPEQVALIDKIADGIPLVVQMVFDFIRMNIAPEMMLPEKTAGAADAAEIIDRIAAALIEAGGDETARRRIFTLAMQYRHDPAVLSLAWGIGPEETLTALTDLSFRFTFMKGMQLHSAVFGGLRRYLIGEAVKGAKSPLGDLFSSYAAAATSVYAQYLAQMENALPEVAQRYADPTYQVTLLGFLSSHLWTMQDRLITVLPGYLAEALSCSSKFAATLLDFTREASSLVGQELQSLLETLRAAGSIAPILEAPLGKAVQGVAAGLDFMEPFQQNMSPLQLGLLHRMKGMLACRERNFKKAMNEFGQSMSLLAPSSPEYALLFDNFLCTGFAFANLGKMRDAADAFQKATAIRPNGFGAWMELARMRQALGDRTAAVVAYAEAVKIKPDESGAWTEMGNEYALLAQHDHAVTAFTHATELDPGRPVGWFKLGISLEALSNFDQARDALQKVLAMVPDHWEAWFALGRCQSGLSLLQESIASYSKVVEIKPDCTEAWKALGYALLAAENYEQSAEALEKAAAADQKNAALWDTIGSAWFRAGNWEKATACCRQAVALDDTVFASWVTLGHALTELGDFNGAHDAFVKAAALNPQDEEIWINLGNNLYAQGNYEESITAFLKATELRPEADNIWHNIGLAYQVQRKFAEAIEAFQRAVDINASVAETWYQKGRSHAEMSDHAKAAECFAKSVELAPDEHDAWNRLGLSLAKSGNHEAAIPSLVKASQLYPSDADLWFQLAQSYLATGQTEKAVEAFTASCTIDGNRPEAHYQLALAQESLDKRPEAIAAYKKAAELAPDKSEIWLHLGLCCNALSQFADSHPALRKALELAPDTNDAFLPLALAAHAVGEYAEAAAYYRKHLATSPDSEEAAYNLALALHAMNNLQEALPAYQTVVQRWPEKGDAWYNMGLAYHAAAKYPEAIEAYDRAVRLNPESTDPWYQLGTLYYATGQYGEAIQALRTVTARDPGSSGAWFTLGNAFFVWHEYADAINAYQKAVEIKPDDFAAWGYLGSAYYATHAYDKAAEAAGKAFALKSDEPWIMSTLVLAKVMIGDAVSAGPILEALLAADGSGQEIAKTAAALQKAVVVNPNLAGAADLLQKVKPGRR